MKNPIDDCLNQFVCVEASGVRYFGTLIEIGEEELYLKTDARWLTVPMERVHSITQVDPAELEKGAVDEVTAADYVPVESEGDEAPVEFGELDESGDEVLDLEPAPDKPDEGK